MSVFQFRLSSALCMMVAAALLLWVNFVRFEDFGGENFHHYGFPVSYLIIHDSEVPPIFGYQSDAIIMKVVFNAGIVLGFGFLAERVFRRVWPARRDT